MIKNEIKSPNMVCQNWTYQVIIKGFKEKRECPPLEILAAYINIYINTILNTYTIKGFISPSSLYTLLYRAHTHTHSDYFTFYSHVRSNMFCLLFALSIFLLLLLSLSFSIYCISPVGTFFFFFLFYCVLIHPPFIRYKKGFYILLFLICVSLYTHVLQCL